MKTPQSVLDYWKSIGPKGWWRKNEDVDRHIISEFGDLHAQAVTQGLKDWENSANACLANVIVLDQFSRNMFRGDARTFAYDTLALDIAKRAVASGFDQQCDPELSKFFYLPYMHAEALEDQNTCVALMHRTGDKASMEAAIEHRMIVERFGRFPHRNPVLGRATSHAEAKFLNDGGFKG